MAEYINAREVRLTRDKYFGLHPEKMRKDYYPGQTEDPSLTEEENSKRRSMAPSNIIINTRKKRDLTKSMNYNSTKKRNEYRVARVVKEALRQIELGDNSGAVPIYYEEFNLTNEEIIRFNERNMCLG